MRRLNFFIIMVIICGVSLLVCAQVSVKKTVYPFPKPAESSVVDLRRTRDVFGDGKVFIYEFEYDGLVARFTNDYSLSEPVENLYVSIGCMTWFPGHEPEITFETLEDDGKQAIVIHAFNYFPNALDKVAYVVCNLTANCDKVDIEVTIP